jgi:hypothetical protein
MYLHPGDIVALRLYRLPWRGGIDGIVVQVGHTQRIAVIAFSFPLAAFLLLTVALLAGCASGATGAATAPASTSLAAGTTSSALPPTTAAPTTTAATAPIATAASTATTGTAGTGTTAGPTTTTTQADPAGWARFAAQGISVALPSSFDGGVPDSAALKARLKTMAGGTTWIVRMRSKTEGFDAQWLMGMLDTSGKTRWAPMMLVYRIKLPDWFPLETYVDTLFSDTPTGDIHVIDKSSVRVEYEVSLPKSGIFPATTVLSVWDYSSDIVYQVSYLSTTATYDQLRDTFMKSVERIKVAPAGGTG